MGKYSSLNPMEDKGMFLFFLTRAILPLKLTSHPEKAGKRLSNIFHPFALTNTIPSLGYSFLFPLHPSMPNPMRVIFYDAKYCLWLDPMLSAPPALKYWNGIHYHIVCLNVTFYTITHLVHV